MHNFSLMPHTAVLCQSWAVWQQQEPCLSRSSSMVRDCSWLGHLRILLVRKLSELFGQMKVPSTAEIPVLLLVMLRIRFKKIL